MQTHVILTVIGSDRPGLTEALAGAVQTAGGNWLESHLSRLGGKYVGSVLVALPDDALETLRGHVAAVDAVGLSVSIVAASTDQPPIGTLLELSLVGQDRPGIVRELSAALARLGVNIEALETGIEGSAWSGSPLFRADAQLMLPDGISAAAVQEALEGISGDMMVDLKAEGSAH
jgi:glycine cleavage system regulatory protein